MDVQHAQDIALHYAAVVLTYIERIPGSGIVLRYIKSSYQNDPIRSAIELILFLFAVRYLLAPSYSTKKPIKEHLTEEVCARYSEPEIEQFAYTEQEIDDLVDDWTPEPIVTPLNEFEQTELEKRPVIVGYVIEAFPALPALVVRRSVLLC
jgi:serine palmitoyltransferase